MAGRTAGRMTPEEVERVVEDMRLVDDEFMKRALKDRPDCLQLIARAALGDDALTVTGVEGQSELPGMPGRRSARLDFLCESSDGRRVNVEIESASFKGFPARRARFYSSLLDVWSLKAGADFNELPDCAVVVICEADQLDRGLQRYTYCRRAEEDSSLFDDGQVIVYVNCEFKDDETAIGRLAHDMLCVNPDDMYNPELADCAREAKKVAKVGAYWDQMKQRAYDEGLAEGREDGMAMGRAEAYFSLVKDGLLASATAADKLGITEAEFARRAAEAGYVVSA